MKLLDKVIVITGGSRGLGLAMAEAMLRQGAKVVIAGRDQASLEQAFAQLKRQSSHVLATTCDVGDLAAIEALRDQTIARFGKLDVWINNAGVAGPYGATVAIHPRDYRRVIDTNIFGTYHGSIVALKYFQQQGHGKLINLFGRGDTGPVPFQTAYGASKSWVRNFTLALAKEHRNQGIEILGFNPGLMTTDMLTDVQVMAGYEAKLEALSTILRMWGNPPSVPAQKAVWLASKATNGRNGLSISLLSPPRLLLGALKEAIRRVRGKPAPALPIKLTTID
ncbi:MAG: SDR family oxidoreductase [Chloroflexi bacterium]|nr:SDR family oxidoreductase [Chloroflexota bacterium]